MFTFIFILSILFVVWLVQRWEEIRIHWMIFLIIQRGILAPNCFWWSVSDRLLPDASGVDLFYEKRAQHGDVIPLAMFGTKMYLLANPDMIRTLYDHSPSVFGPGTLKKDFFASFMPGNVGVAQDATWARLRIENEHVLQTGRVHSFAAQWDRWIRQALRIYGTPLQFRDFSEIATFLTIRIVFGECAPIDPKLFDIFHEANAISFFWSSGNHIISKKTQRYFERYLDEALENPDPTSLVSMMPWHDRSARQQIPHWIFPLAGLFSVSLPRLLLLSTTITHGRVPWRSQILETLRLNNPVVTTFRTLREPWKGFETGTQFLILNNPILRDTNVFPCPNQYQPERWSSALERSYYAIMFGQGPQKCPGKNVSITLLELAAVAILECTPSMRGTFPKLGKEIPQMINPCTIQFTTKGANPTD